jgi:hypothetical protein
MNKDTLKKLLDAVRQGSVSIDDAVKKLEGLPFEDLDFAKPDTHRPLRCGFSEVIYCPGKTPTQITSIARRLAKTGHPVLLTKADEEAYEAAAKARPSAVYHPEARLVVIPAKNRPKPIGLVSVVSAGTTDIPIAEEAALTAEVMGARVERLYDVGVAGVHRLFAHTSELAEAKAIVAVAGMEGALPSLIGGIVSCPVIAVPTSVGYGANLGGITALLGMLTSCAPGVSAVNIDNGFGAGYIAATINRQAAKPRDSR